jgi:amino acid transporter
MSSQVHRTHNAKMDDLRKSNRYCAIALVLMSIALGFYGIGVFLISPTNIVGILSFIIGLLCMAGSASCFALYARYSRKSQHE